MVNFQLFNLHQSVRITPRDRVKREHREISSVKSWINVSDCQMAL